MAAKDYQICCGSLNAYIAKTSKKDANLMLSDRKVIGEDEILMLIEWYIEQWCVRNNKLTSIEVNTDSKPCFELIPKGELEERIKSQITKEE